MKSAETHTVPHFEYHADDYGLFPAQSRRILDCREIGNLNGVSVMPNSLDLDQCMAMLGQQKDLAVTVHLNLVEGASLCGAEVVPDITDGLGNLNGSFGKLLVCSYGHSRHELRRQLKKELRAQIQAVMAYFPPDTPIRLDGHAHYHMIPVVFDALMDVIREDGLKVSYIRLPKEYVGLYLRHLGQFHDFVPINLVKVAILNLLVARNRRKYRAFLDKLEKRVFLGVFLSGRMYRENVEPLLPDVTKLAEKKGWDVELLAHPGGVLEPEDVAKLTSQDDVTFLTSPMRERETSLFQIGVG